MFVKHSNSNTFKHNTPENVSFLCLQQTHIDRFCHISIVLDNYQVFYSID